MSIGTVRVRLRARVLRLGGCLFACLAPYLVAGLAQSQDSDVPPEYLSTKLTDPVSQLIARLKDGTAKLSYTPGHGYLESVLKELGISSASQLLVFSKTSFQSAYISPRNPRALYFNDRAYVGWIPGAPNLELVGVDPVVGPVFFTLRNSPVERPLPDRQVMDCLQCHDSPMTGQVPGLMARSVYAGADGMPRLSAGTFMTTSTSPMKERWGGWYVTGRHGSQRHLGNEPARGDEQAPVIDIERGANVTDLSRYFGVGAYLSPSSDIVALMVAEQQMTIQNLITRAGYATRKAVKDGDELLRLKFEPDHVAEETRDRVKHACEPLVAALLGSEEPSFTDPIQGSAVFATTFSKSAPADRLGRRLSELDLKRRLLRFPCSPMIYSPAFAGLPGEARMEVLRRLHDVLTGKDQSKPYAHLSTEDRQAVRGILVDTVPEFAALSGN